MLRQHHDPEENAPIAAARDREWQYSVRVCGFTFKFDSLVEIQHALDWFSQKTHPSSQIHDWAPERFCDRQCSARWFERLPSGLTSNRKRPRVVKALQRAIHEFSK